VTRTPSLVTLSELRKWRAPSPAGTRMDHPKLGSVKWPARWLATQPGGEVWLALWPHALSATARIPAMATAALDLTEMRRRLPADGSAPPPVAHAAFAERADPVSAQAPTPVVHLGINEHRRGRARWRADDQARGRQPQIVDVPHRVREEPARPPEPLRHPRRRGNRDDRAPPGTTHSLAEMAASMCATDRAGQAWTRAGTAGPGGRGRRMTPCPPRSGARGAVVPATAALYGLGPIRLPFRRNTPRLNRRLSGLAFWRLWRTLGLCAVTR